MLHRLAMVLVVIGTTAAAQGMPHRPSLASHPAPPPNDAANRPAPVMEANAVIVHGPLVLAASQTSATIEWTTNVPSITRIEYGTQDFQQTAEANQFGQLPVGTLHRIELTGLKAGQRYQYRIVATPVVRLKPYWPVNGTPTRSAVYSLTTLPASDRDISFSLITDTHESLPRINALMNSIQWSSTDFLVHLGDGLDYATDEDQVFDHWLDPIGKALNGKPVLIARGNHEWRGPFARSMANYLTPVGEGRYFYARSTGPVHFLVMDSGEDKPDATPVYAGLNQQAPYRTQELEWFREQVKSNSDLAAAPFRVVLMHQPDWGWLDGHNADWTKIANEAKVDLVIAGHYHRFVHFNAGEAGNNYPVLVVGQDQVARVDASSDKLHVTVTATDGTIVDSFDVPRRAH
ncbi:metallophosphoesterase [Edaphobacter flagellatus]|uniref:metallophosphoesterase n=1 Tax=Edaphobacter flagellatus TaxID=1933044 RepID=UPI0021B3D2A0|nr:metallophosphoesterase [Edaphobacter flagellatus]